MVDYLGLEGWKSRSTSEALRCVHSYIATSWLRKIAMTEVTTREASKSFQRTNQRAQS